MKIDLSEAQAAEVVRIRERILALIDTHFGAGKTAYYLSQLGNELGEDRKTLESLTQRKLSEFVSDAFDYEIGRGGQHENVLYIVGPEGSVGPPEANPRYNGRVWAAFKMPLPQGERRFISLETFQFANDAAQLGGEGSSVREIDTKFLPRDAVGAAPDETPKRIAAWLASEALDPAPFLLQRRKQHVSQESLLVALINALDGDQLKRVSLPLDVIKTLEARRLV